MSDFICWQTRLWHEKPCETLMLMRRTESFRRFLHIQRIKYYCCLITVWNEMPIRARHTARSRVGLIHGSCSTFQVGIPVGCGFFSKSNDHASDMIIVVDVSVFPMCLFLWICLSYLQRNDQRITSNRRRSQGVIDHFQLKLLARHIVNMTIICPIYDLFSWSLFNIRCFLLAN
jgi:hypothetical protein